MDRNAVPTERWFWWQQIRVVIRAQHEEVEGEPFLEGMSPRRGEGRKQECASWSAFIHLLNLRGQWLSPETCPCCPEMEGILEGHSLTWAGVRPAWWGPGPSPLPRLPSVS